MAKRRRLNGSPEEGLARGDPASVDFVVSQPDPDDPAPPPALATDRTEILDPPDPRLPPPHLNPDDLPRDAPPAAPSSRGEFPEAIPIGNAAVAGPEAVPLTPLELRIRRLEDALAQLQMRRAAETRVTIQPVRPAAPAAPAPAAPAAEPPYKAPTDKLWDLGKRVLGGPTAGRVRAAWLLREALAEARAIVRMFTDPRYRLSWTGRIAPAALLFSILLSWWWVPFTSVPIVGTLLNKVVDLLLAFVLFKVLTHEARRYRELAPDLPASLRL